MLAWPQRDERMHHPLLSHLQIASFRFGAAKCRKLLTQQESEIVGVGEPTSTI